MKKKYQLIKIISFSIILTITSLFISKPKTEEIKATKTITTNQNIDKDQKIIMPQKKIPERKEITLSFLGDCTLGTDKDFMYHTLPQVFNETNKNYNYFFENVKEILDKDDLTIANLETTFTDSTNERPKLFNFKGDKTYVNILKEGSVEIVNLANNHILDYYEKGKNDTIMTLENANVDYYGETIFLIKEIDNIKIGFIGLDGFDDINKTKIQIKTALDYFNEKNVSIKIVSFHWGIERENYFNNKQQLLGRYAIDNGADLIVGHHPHVLQGIEEYNKRYIVYSLGNFVFGGNSNPYDKDSIIFQETFIFNDEQLIEEKINIIPVSISSKQNINDYQPTLLQNESKQKVLNRINKYSHNFKY